MKTSLSASSRLPHAASRTRQLRLEALEDRRMLAGRAADAVNLFAYDLYEQMRREQGNLAFSPLSITTALAMAYAGAAGQTADEIEQVFHFGSEPGIHEAFQTLIDTIETDNLPGEFPVVQLANAIWPSQTFPPKEEFVDLISQYYGGHAENVDYGNPQQAEETINEWVENQTHGKIKDLVRNLGPSTVMVLTNAIYFQALWAQPFDPEDTAPGMFRTSDGDYVPVEMMSRQDIGLATSIDGFDVLQLSFANNDASMVFILPPSDDPNAPLTPALLSQIDAWLAAPTATDGDGPDVYLPKFDIEVETSLNRVLAGLGMPTAFELGGADFSNMFVDGGPAIKDVFHKATITVNEQGTEAAAATKVEFYLCFAKGTPVLTPDGQKPIEELRAGDLVLARDEYNLEGKVEPKPVERLLTGEAAILELHLGSRVIRTTELHRFFAYKKGWIPAGELQPGDRLSTDTFDWATVDRVVPTNHTEPVFNLRVADHRTYFVGSRDWGYGVWVHNIYEGELHVDRAFDFQIRDNATSTILFMGRVDDPTQSANSVNPTVIDASADFDNDGDVDGRDFLAWQRGYGMAASAVQADGDSDHDGDVDRSDLLTWQADYGQGPAPLSGLLLSDDAATTRGATRPSDRTSFDSIDAALALDMFTADTPDRESAAAQRESAVRETSTPRSRLSDRAFVQRAAERRNTFRELAATTSDQQETRLSDSLLESIFSEFE